MQVPRSHRLAFTLVELLTVIAIITILAALTAIYFPRFQDQEIVNRGADQLQGWLLSAKMQAKRDGLPTGIRLNGAPMVKTVDYIQQPNSFAQGFYTGFTSVTLPTPPNPAGTVQMTALISLPIGVSFTSGPSQVFAGDYLEVYGGGMLHRISADATQTGNVVSLVLDPGLALLPTPSSPASFTNYRIIPQPRPMSGEQALTLPNNVAISFEKPDGINTLSQNVPSRNGSSEILFAPSGAVVGQGTGTGQIILWLRDVSKVPITTADLLVGKGTLIVVQPRTGFIAAHPVASTAAPYAFTRDGRSSGF